VGGLRKDLWTVPRPAAMMTAPHESPLGARAMKTEAQVLTAFKQPLEMQEFDLAPLADGEVLVRVTYAGVCGSEPPSSAARPSAT